MERKERQDKAIKLYLEGNKSINQISKELKSSWETIKKDLLEAGIEIKNKRNHSENINGVSPELFKEINDEDSAYWLGFLYADGNIRKNGNEITLDLQQKDKEAVEEFHKYCKNQNSIREHRIYRRGKTYISYVSGFSNKNIKLNLIKLGCAPNKSLTLTFPNEHQVPDRYIYDFIRGYIDGDGYIQYDFDKHRYRIVITSTKEFLLGMVKRLGMKEYYYLNQDNKSKIWNLTISNKENVFLFLEKLYENSKYHLKRKFDIYNMAKRAYSEQSLYESH